MYPKLKFYNEKLAPYLCQESLIVYSILLIMQRNEATVTDPENYKAFNLEEIASTSHNLASILGNQFIQLQHQPITPEYLTRLLEMGHTRGLLKTKHAVHPTDLQNERT